MSYLTKLNTSISNPANKLGTYEGDQLENLKVGNTDAAPTPVLTRSSSSPRT